MNGFHGNERDKCEWLKYQKMTNDIPIKLQITMATCTNKEWLIKL